MYEVRIQCPPDFSMNKADSVLSKLSNSLEYIRYCYVDNKQREIVVHTKCDNENEVIGTAEELIANEKSIREFKKVVIKEKKLDASKVEKKSEISDVNYKGILNSDSGLQLLESIDKLFEKIIRTKGAKNKKVSTLIARETLEQCGYIHNFPQNIYMVSQFPHRLETLKQVRDSDDYNKYTELSEHALSPAVCFHCYQELKDQVFHEPVLLTSVNTCYRHEADWRVNNYRLKEFKMREMVYLGSPEYVDEIRYQMLEIIWELFNSLNLYGRVETASDPFYFNEDLEKSMHQLFAKMKYELVVTLPNQEQFSIASFNNVANSLCKVFGIVGENNEFLYSGCTAFGIDRWAYTLLVTYGTDFANWPTKVKEILSIA